MSQLRQCTIALDLLPDNALIQLAEADEPLGDTEGANGPDSLTRVQIRSIRVRDFKTMAASHDLSDIHILSISFPSS